MKDIDQATALTIAWAKLLIHEMQSLGTAWTMAFLRVEAGDGYQRCKGSYVLLDGTSLFDAAKHKTMFLSTQRIAQELREAASSEGKRFCVALLVVDFESNYEIHYEYDDCARWAISKLDSASGLPSGYVA